MPNHHIIDARSLAFDQAIAAKLREDPSLLKIARATVSRWLKIRDEEHRGNAALLEWVNILNHSELDDILKLLLSDSEKACRLRQSSPFTAILSSQERWEIIKRFNNKAKTS